MIRVASRAHLRGEQLARPAPRGVKVHEDGDGGAGDEIVERGERFLEGDGGEARGKRGRMGGKEMTGEELREEPWASALSEGILTASSGRLRVE